MATNILSIPQIPTVDLLPLQNDLHIGFTGDIAKRLHPPTVGDAGAPHCICTEYNLIFIFNF